MQERSKMERIITIRIPEKLYNDIERYANDTKRPISNAIRFMLEKYLEALWEDN